MGGVTADADVVAVEGEVYAKLPFTTRFVPIDPADYSAPDPADLLDDQGGLSSLLTAATEVQAGKKVRDGKVVLSSFTGEVPGTAVARVIPQASKKASFSAIFTLTDDDELSRAVLSGPFYPACPTTSPTPSTSTGTAPARTSGPREVRTAPGCCSAWQPSPWGSPRPTPTSWCWRCRT